MLLFPIFLGVVGDLLRAFPTFSAFGMFSRYDREKLALCNVLRVDTEGWSRDFSLYP